MSAAENNNRKEVSLGLLEDTIKSFVTQSITTMAKLGGVKASDKVAEERKKICRDCPEFGSVYPLQKIKLKVAFDGCKKCGCPVDTKPHFLKHIENGQLVTTECPLKKW